jgi:hypothetical protein
MLSSRLPQSRVTAAALAPIASVALLTGYCQLWSTFEHGVPIAVSLQWALINTATLAVFSGLLWISRHRIFAWVEDAHPAHLVTTVGIIFGAATAAMILSTLATSAMWGDGVQLTALSKRLLSLSPLLLAAAVAVTAVIAAVRWKSMRSGPAHQSNLRDGDWLELPEAPLLRLRSSDVAVIRTARNYCELEIAERSVLVRVTAKRLEQRLSGQGFVRVHRGAIVNLSRVRVVQRGRSRRLRLLLDDGSELSVSKGHRARFIQRLAATTRTSFRTDWAA